VKGGQIVNKFELRKEKSTLTFAK